MSTQPARRQKSSAWTDYFLHESFYANADLQHRARVLIQALYAFTGISLFAALVVLFLPTTPAITLIAVLCCALITIGFVYLLFRLKRHGRYKSCATIAISIHLTAIVIAISLTGGISDSPAAQLLVLQPLVAFFFTGIRDGCITTAVIGALIALQVGLQRAGVEFLQGTPPDYLGVVWLGLLLIGFFVIAVMALVYELTSRSLRKERDTEHAKVVQLANTDSLTGLANRRAFDDALNARINAYRLRKNLGQFTLCYLDLDGFKPINDQHGHDVGDQVLRAVSIRLRSSLRGADVIGRQGGDEFMLLLNGLGGNRSLEIMAQRFIDMVKQPIETSAGLVSVGVSLGFALYPHHASAVEALKKAADMAMYTAKRNRAGWHLYVSNTSASAGENESRA